jgi:catechol 2,3-dioxygenase-like lactoylglutathione lyase family enzyme
MAEIVGVAEAVLYVSDLDRSAHFYGQVLGLPLTASFNEARFFQTGKNSSLILFDAEGIRKRKSLIPSHGATGAGHVALAVPAEAMASWRERLIANGVVIEHNQEWSLGTNSIYFRDPDDNSLELIDASHYRRFWQQIQSSEAD